MLKLRLKRMGKKNSPHYRIVVMPARSKRDGKAVEYIGHYNPKSKELKLDVDRAKYWLSVGAQPTDTVHSFLAKHKLIKAQERPKLPPKKPKKQQKEEEKKAPPPKEDTKSKKKAVVKEKQKSAKEEKDKKS